MIDIVQAKQMILPQFMAGGSIFRSATGKRVLLERAAAINASGHPDRIEAGPQRRSAVRDRHVTGQSPRCLANAQPGASWRSYLTTRIGSFHPLDA